EEESDTTAPTTTQKPQSKTIHSEPEWKKLLKAKTTELFGGDEFAAKKPTKKNPSDTSDTEENEEPTDDHKIER
ncbi:MAG: hypothetical protein RR318_07945, partial [Alistipes sp.]